MYADGTEKDHLNKHFHMDREEEETHHNPWVTEILRLHGAATVRVPDLGVSLPVRVTTDLGPT